MIGGGALGVRHDDVGVCVGKVQKPTNKGKRKQNNELRGELSPSMATPEGRWEGWPNVGGATLVRAKGCHHLPNQPCSRSTGACATLEWTAAHLFCPPSPKQWPNVDGHLALLQHPIVKGLPL